MNEFEDLYLQCCVKLSGNNGIFNENLLNGENTQSQDQGTAKLLQKIFLDVDIILRQLMGVAEMERMFAQGVEEICAQSQDLSEMFFCDNTFIESESDMAILAMICDLNYDKESPKDLVNDAM
jgi:hypothetical protein